MELTNILELRDGRKLDLPLFLPVYQPRSNLIPIESMKQDFGIRGMIMNGFFLYKNAETRELLEGGLDVHDYVGFEGMIMTDSGAFQGLKRPLYLSNKKIVAFQDKIGADIVSPLDLINPPGDNRTQTAKKLKSTNKRIKEALGIVQNGILAGVQQGGKFLDLRRQSMEALMEMEIEYLAIGSLVPFFNKNHDLRFAINVVREAREMAGPDMPMHVYGAGDPCELPFLAAAGANIFDSSSYGHYAIGGWYMTPYGAVNSPELFPNEHFRCTCPVCRDQEGIASILEDQSKLAIHNLWVILQTVDAIGTAWRQGTLDAMLQKIITVHQEWFPDSALPKSVEAFI